MIWSEWRQVEGFDLKEVIYEKKYRDLGGGVARVQSNRPQRMNALTNRGFGEMARSIRDANQDPDIAVIVVGGVGDHFGVGGDMEWEASGGLDPDAGGGLTGGLPNPAAKASLKPVIAAVQGYCIGGHNHLAYQCDFTIAADDAILGQNGPRVASPAHGATVSYLSYVVGHKKAREIWMLCRRYTAQEALLMGLVNAVVPRAKLDEEVDKWCEELMAIAPTCLAAVKQSFEAIGSYLNGIPSSLSMIAPNFYKQEEVKEAQQAFLEKRTPNFWKYARKASEE